jgi:translation initiation factor IF-3
MKVKVTLRFRGREMAHKEYGFSQVQKFIKEITPYGHPDADPKLIGKGIVLMLSPLPRNKRAKHPRGGEPEGGATAPEPEAVKGKKAAPTEAPSEETESSGFANAPFTQLENKVQG